VGLCNSIGSTVFVDNNNNGQQDVNDGGISGVIVELLDASGTTLATTTTDSQGNYFFNNLDDGDYQVRIPVQGNFGNDDPLAQLSASSDPTDTNDNQQDGDDNGTQVGGKGATVVSPIITLAGGTEPTNCFCG